MLFPSGELVVAGSLCIDSSLGQLCWSLQQEKQHKSGSSHLVIYTKWSSSSNSAVRSRFWSRMALSISANSKPHFLLLPLLTPPPGTSLRGLTGQPNRDHTWGPRSELFSLWWHSKLQTILPRDNPKCSLFFFQGGQIKLLWLRPGKLGRNRRSLPKDPIDVT